MNPNVVASYALISRLRDLGVTQAVVSPGSRSMPLAYAAAELLEVTVVIDERDAGFVALGIGESSMPAVVITTSGSAPTHLYPAVVEAYHSNVGIIVLSADRPHDVRGRGAAQTIDQTNLYGTAVRYSIDADLPSENSSVDYWCGLADDLFRFSYGSGDVCGPVQLNMGFTEPLVPDGDEKSIFSDLVQPKSETIRYETVGEEISEIASLIDGARCLITVGRNSHADGDVVGKFAERFGWPVLADVTSGLRDRDDVVTHYDAMVRDARAKDLLPDVVIELGEPLISQKFNAFISDVAQVISIKRFDDHRDPYGRHTYVKITPDVNGVLSSITESLSNEMVASPYVDMWDETNASVSMDSACEENSHADPAVMKAIGDVLSDVDQDIQVLVASSMPIRYADWCWNHLASTVSVYSHRGTNGIDGMIASAAGIARGSKQSTLCVVGDVAFAHNVGALATANAIAKENDLTVIYFIVDNGGGSIFKFLPQANNETLAPHYEKLIQTPPALNIEAMAIAAGARYENVDPAKTEYALRDALAQELPGTIVIHTQVDHESGPAFMTELNTRLGAAGL